MSDQARDALMAAACFALDPVAMGGILVRTNRDESCERWLECLRALLDAATPLRRLPIYIDDERLLGGIDLAATLRLGRACYSRGLLAEADAGAILISMTESMPRRVAAVVAAAMDTHVIDVAGTGRERSRFGLVALDSGQSEEEGCPAMIAERLALHIDLRLVPAQDLIASGIGPAQIARARSHLPAVRVEAQALKALCTAASACGIDSLRAPLMALRVTRFSAALNGRDTAIDEDLELAARLVLGPRARTAPQSSQAEPQSSQGEPPSSQAEPQSSQGDDASEPPPPPRSSEATEPAVSASVPGETFDEQVLSAVRATLPAGLLAGMISGDAAVRRSKTAGRVGAAILKGRLGRPAGVQCGRPRPDARLNILATLRAAAPWQVLRRAEIGAPASRVVVHAEDFRVTWYRQRSQCATLFVLDASGSSAMHRLAEVKGAVELLLAECYVRRDQVAVLAFRGRSAELVLPPTRSLVRAKRSLAGLPGGGATPLAAGLTLARQLGEQLRRRGLAPVMVVLTDGQANVARDGTSSRARAQEDAVLAAKQLRAGAFKSLLIDTAPRAQPQAQALAQTMQARYLPLPYADARTLLDAVKSTV